LPISTIQPMLKGKQAILLQYSAGLTVRNRKAALAYSVSHLGVQHVIVMGHYGCGGVAAAISGPPAGHLDEGDLAIHAAVSSIRQLYKTSNRAEIVKLRQKSANPSQTVPPEIYNGTLLLLSEGGAGLILSLLAGFKALVEENVKASVSRIAKDSVITDVRPPPSPFRFCRSTNVWFSVIASSLITVEHRTQKHQFLCLSTGLFITWRSERLKTLTSLLAHAVLLSLPSPSLKSHKSSYLFNCLYLGLQYQIVQTNIKLSTLRRSLLASNVRF